MHIHIGEKKIVSSGKIIGLFNADTLRESSDNEWILSQIDNDDKCISVENTGKILSSGVSSFTVIKRDSIIEEAYWSRIDDKV